MAYHDGAATNTAIPKSPNLQSTIEDFDPVIARVEQLVERASNCGDRIVGSRPAEVNAAKDAPPPNNLIFAAQSRRSRLARAVDFLEQEISRIEGGLA